MARRIPRDQRPALGDWDGPIYGELGVLELVDDHLRCHICGEWFRHLSSHVLRKHGVHPDEYRSLFGLRASRSLVSPGVRQSMREAHIGTLSQHWDGQGLRQLTAAERVENARNRKWSLQERQDPNNIAIRRENWGKAQEGAARARAEGRQWWRDAREIGPMGRERFRQLVEDPEWKAGWANKIKDSKGGRTPVSCIVCETRFVSMTGRRTCSDECERESRRRSERVSKRPDVRAKISQAALARGRTDLERLRTLPASAFASLAELDRTVTLLYYGLNGEPPQTHRQLAAKLGISTSTVRQRILRTVAQLIGNAQASWAWRSSSGSTALLDRLS